MDKQGNMSILINVDQFIDQGRPLVRRRTFALSDFEAFARLSGDDNPIHVDPEFAARTRFGRPVAHGMFLYGVICGLLHELFPGGVQVEQQLIFPAPTFAGEEMEIHLSLIEQRSGDQLLIKTDLFDQAGTQTVDGQALLHWAGGHPSA